MKKILKFAAVFALAAFVSSQAFAKKAKGSAEAGNTEAAAGGETSANSKTKKSKEKKEKVKKPKKIPFNEEQFNSSFYAGDYATCLSMMLSKEDRKKDVILNSIDTNMLMHLNGDYLGSGKAFLETQRLMQQSKKDTAGGKKAGAAMSNETATKYTGNMYERILMYTMRAVNALSMGDIGNAKGVMDTYAGDYKDIIAPLIAEQKALAEEDDDTEDADADGSLKNAGLTIDSAAMNSRKPPKSTKVYENSPLLQYLSAIIYAAHAAAEGQGIEHAEKAASELKTLNPNVSVAEDVAIPSGKGRINVLALSGTIGKRTEKTNEFDAGILSGVPIKFKIAYPVFEPQTHAITAVRVTLNDGTSKTATLVEDFDEAVRLDVALKARGAYSRSVFRNVMRVVTAFATLESARIADQVNSNLITQIALATAKIAFPAAVAANKSERADLRQGAYFPHKASAAGFTVAPGTYSAKVEYLSGNSVLETKNLENIVVKTGKPTIVISSCAK